VHRLADEPAVVAVIETAGAHIGARGFIARTAMEMAACDGKVCATDMLRQDANARRIARPCRVRPLPRDCACCAVDRA
ncbi:hypothetical protein SB912_31470, partial [Pantoea sp. SIMBA_072]